MEMRFHQDPRMQLDSALLLEKIQGVHDNLSQRRDREEWEPVNGAAGNEIGPAIFHYPVSASSHYASDCFFTLCFRLLFYITGDCARKPRRSL